MTYLAHVSPSLVQKSNTKSICFAAQTEGDLDLAPSSGGASVRFGDALEDGLASDADSTESRFGSRENLLDPGPILSRHSSVSNGRLELSRLMSLTFLYASEKRLLS